MFLEHIFNISSWGHQWSRILDFLVPSTINLKFWQSVKALSKINLSAYKSMLVFMLMDEVKNKKKLGHGERKLSYPREIYDHASNQVLRTVEVACIFYLVRYGNHVF